MAGGGPPPWLGNPYGWEPLTMRHDSSIFSSAPTQTLISSSSPSATPIHGFHLMLPWLVMSSLYAPRTEAQNKFITSSEENTASSPSSSGPLKTVLQWKQLDFIYPTEQAREDALMNGDLIPENMLPLGLEVWRNRLFLTLPRWKEGIPASLVTVDLPRSGKGRRNRSIPSPPLRPYPSWEWHERNTTCDVITNVFRIAVDRCDRLWVLDSGLVEVVEDATPHCPPQIIVFDLKTDKLLWRYRLPKKQVKIGSLFSNIIVDIRGNDCENAYAYLTDVWRYGLVVYSWLQDDSWRITHPYFYPNPLLCKYEVHGVDFQWTDGIFGMALGREDPVTGDRILYFHPMSSDREFAVSTSVIRNETSATAEEVANAFSVIGDRRLPISRGHSSASASDHRGVNYYNLVTQDAIGCWNSEHPNGYSQSVHGIVQRDNETLIFPNDLKVDHGSPQSIWVISNRLPIYLYKSLDPNDVNFRVMTTTVEDATRGTVCDPALTNRGL